MLRHQVAHGKNSGLNIRRRPALDNMSPRQEASHMIIEGPPPPTARQIVPNGYLHAIAPSPAGAASRRSAPWRRRHIMDATAASPAPRPTFLPTYPHAWGRDCLILLVIAARTAQSDPAASTFASAPPAPQHHRASLHPSLAP